jgi:hypothetical protein
MISNAEFNTIAALDLNSIKAKLMDKESGEGWTLEQANAVELEYRRFLYLMKLFPHEQTAPLLNVDIFWHNHILDTMKYAADCAQVFGYFLHHVPYDGLHGEDDEAAHERTGARMQELYEATFGEAYIREGEGRAAAAWCSPTTAQAAWCSPATPKAAWCSPTMPKAAWCSPAAPKAAWCSPATAKTAWCSPTVAKIAWCSPATAETAKTAKTAWCSPAVAETSWQYPGAAISGRTHALAPNDQSYSHSVFAHAA